MIVKIKICLILGLGKNLILVFGSEKIFGSNGLFRVIELLICNYLGLFICEVCWYNCIEYFLLKICFC